MIADNEFDELFLFNTCHCLAAMVPGAYTCANSIYNVLVVCLFEACVKRLNLKGNARQIVLPMVCGKKEDRFFITENFSLPHASRFVLF